MPIRLAPSASHAIALDLDPGAPYRFVGEPAQFMPHIWARGAGVVSHTALVYDHPATKAGWGARIAGMIEPLIAERRQCASGGAPRPRRGASRSLCEVLLGKAHERRPHNPLAPTRAMSAGGEPDDPGLQSLRMLLQCLRLSPAHLRLPTTDGQPTRTLRGCSFPSRAKCGARGRLRERFRARVAGVGMKRAGRLRRDHGEKRPSLPSAVLAATSAKRRLRSPPVDQVSICMSPQIDSACPEMVRPLEDARKSIWSASWRAVTKVLSEV